MHKSLSLILALLLLLALPAQAQTITATTAEPYTFLSPAFEAEARRALSLPTGPITPDMLGTITSISITDTPIETFADLAMFTALDTLTLENVGLTDLTPLSGLKRLLNVNLKGNAVKSLKPLESLRLVSLEISDAPLQDIRPLAKMDSLWSLSLENTRLQSLPNMSGMVQLEMLTITGSSLTDIAPLAKLPGLRTLHLDDNAITSVKPLAGLYRITALTLSGNKIKDITPLAGLQTLTTLDLTGNPIKDFSPIWKMDASAAFKPQYTLDVQAKDSALTITMLPGCKAPEPGATRTFEARLAPSVRYSELDIVDAFTLGFEDTHTITLMPLTPYALYEIGGTKLGRTETLLQEIPAAKVSRYRAYSLAVDRGQLTWVEDVSGAYTLGEAFLKYQLKDQAAAKITHEQVRELVDGTRHLVHFVAISMNTAKEAAETEVTMVLTGPDGTQAVVDAGPFAFVEGGRPKWLMFAGFSDGVAAYFAGGEVVDGAYTLDILLDGGRVTTAKFTVVP